MKEKVIELLRDMVSQLRKRDVEANERGKVLERLCVDVENTAEKLDECIANQNKMLGMMEANAARQAQSDARLLELERAAG